MLPILILFNVVLLKGLTRCQVDFTNRNKSVIVLPPMLMNYDALYKDVGYTISRAAFLKFDGKNIDNTIVAGTDCAKMPLYIGRSVNRSYVLMGAVDSSSTLTVGIAGQKGLLQKVQFQVFVNGTLETAQWLSTTADKVKSNAISPMIAGHWLGNPQNPMYICRSQVQCGFMPGYARAEDGQCYVEQKGNLAGVTSYEIIVLVNGSG